MRAIACLAAAALGASASGCSFVVVRGPPRDTPPGVVPRCTTAPIAPIVDTGLFGLSVLGAVVAHQRLGEPDGGEFPNNDFLRMQRTFSIVAAVLEAAAAGYGYVKVGACRRTLQASPNPT
ncbi:MAG: hypothetical protein F9K40_11960 [Kofleriaceae bacterium]|nr:MAG: hypothetical protein F9K40_11960 [Kofleriaceae bacterium]